MSSKNKYAIALDLSLSSTGVAIFDENENPIHVDTIITDSKDLYPARLKTIADGLSELAEKYPPSVIIIEKGFTRFHASTQALFRTQGVAMMVLCRYPQFFYSPSTIKKCVTGRGNASKDSVQQCVLDLYPELKMSNTDQSDAVAAGITHFQKTKENGGNNGKDI